MEGEVSIEIVQKPKVIFWYKTCFSVLFFFQDQYDVIDKHTQSGLDLLDRYIKFVKERSEIEQNYAKQLRCGPSEWLFIFIWNGILSLFFVCALTLCMLVKWMFLHFSNRNLTKKYAKRGNREDQDCKWENKNLFPAPVWVALLHFSISALIFLFVYNIFLVFLVFLI